MYDSILLHLITYLFYKTRNLRIPPKPKPQLLPNARLSHLYSAVLLLLVRSFINP